MSIPDRRPLRILSYGGGTQSAALALMSAQGDLPKLDAVIFAEQGDLFDGATLAMDCESGVCFT